MARSGSGCRFRNLNYFKLDLFIHFPKIHYTLEVMIKNIIVENHQFNVILSCVKQNFENHLFNITTCTIF